MYEQVEKPKENKSRAVANSVAQKKADVKQGFAFVDHRPEIVTQLKIQAQIRDRSLHGGHSPQLNVEGKREIGAVKLYSEGQQLIQRQVSLRLLENERDKWVKDGPKNNFNNVVDYDTKPNSSAHLVGKYWIEAGGERVQEKRYGATPLDFQYNGDQGKRNYRPPMIKQSGQSKGALQANYEELYGKYKFNAHVTLTGEQSNRKEIEAGERAEFAGIVNNQDPNSIPKPKWYEI